MSKTRNEQALPPSATDEPHDPDPSELEIDAANDSMRGPTTASHSAGLSSALEPDDADTGKAHPSDNE